MKILVDLTSLADNFSGIERFAMSVTRELCKDETNEYILVFKNQVHKTFADKPEHVTHVVLRGGNKLIFNQITLPFFLWGQKADCYLFPAFPAPFLFCSKRSISAIHDVSCWDCPQSNKKHMILYFKILYRKAAMGKGKILTVSQFSKARIMDILGVKEERISVVHNGLSEYLLEGGAPEMGENASGANSDRTDAQVREKYRLPADYLLCLATLEPRKNLKLLIAAYADLLTEGKVVQDLVLAGRKGWMMDDLLATVDWQVTEHIRFTGFVDEEDLPSVYRQAKMFVFPSLYEGFGVPPIEAMCMGTPVISSDASSLPEVLGDAAEYFKSEDKEDLKRAILHIGSLDVQERDAMVQKGIKRACTYTWEKSGKDLQRVIKQK